MSKRLIMGKNCVREVLEKSPERIISLYTSHRDFASEPFFKVALDCGIPVQFLGKREMEVKVNSESHQGVIALVKPRHEIDLKTFLRQKEEDSASIVLLLDSIHDPQNFGTLLRAAECFGADAVIWSKNRGVEVTPVVTKTSVGASELLEMIRVSNLADSIRKLKEAGYQVITAEVGHGAKNLYEARLSDRVALVMGSEGEGVQPLISKLADVKVYIPMFGRIDSLNVSQATAVLLSYLRRPV